MPGDSEKYDALLPIPTYDEAISSRPSSSQSVRGSTRPEDDAERRGLLGGASASATVERNGNYHRPTVESVRSSCDDEFTSLDSSEGEDEEDLRRDMEQMEVTDPEAERRAQQRARMRLRLQKGIATLTETLSNIHLPRMPGGWNMSSFRSPFTPFRNVAVPERMSISWPIVARLVALFIIAALVYVLVVLRVLPSRGIVVGQRYEAESVRNFLMRHVDATMIQRQLREVSFDDHIAGTKGDFFLASWMQKQFESAQLDDVATENFEVYLNYPRPNGCSVAIIDPEEKKWTAKLQEDDVSGANIKRHQADVFHGLSHSGNVTGPLIYANYGHRQDFQYLEEKGIKVEGSIVLLRYYGTQSDMALKVKAAELAGAAGCLIYSDPNEDGFVRGHAAPEGPWRSPDSVQRGAVSLWSWVAGDVLTPGWASTSDAPRLETADNVALVGIPSLPLAWRDAEPLLRSIGKQGLPGEGSWRGGIPKLEYWTGDISTSPTVHLMNLQDEVAHQPIQNVIGRIQGTESLQATSPEIYIGNHRDAWCFGAVDPGSGTAIFLELVRVFGELAQNGWRPRRSIVFVSWDAEEYNLIGSTEHVEARVDLLRQRGVAYINIADAVYGDQLRASGSAILMRPFADALAMVVDPTTNKTLLDSWNDNHSHLTALGARDDTIPFQTMAGTSSIQVGFGSSEYPKKKDEQDGRPYPLNSCHDTLSLVETHIDPGLKNHALLTQVLALLIHSLSDSAIMPFDLPAYAHTIQTYARDLDRDISTLLRHTNTNTTPPPPNPQIDTAPLLHAADLLITKADQFAQWEAEYHALQMAAQHSPTSADPPAPGVGETHELTIQRVARNARMAEFETRLLDVPDPGGAPGGGLASVSLPVEEAKNEAEREMGARREALSKAGRFSTPPAHSDRIKRADGDGKNDKDHHHHQGSAEKPDPAAPHGPPRKSGLPFRPQFKHVIYGPLAWGDGRTPLPFPGVRDAMAIRDWEGVREQLAVVAEVLANAAARLVL